MAKRNPASASLRLRLAAFCPWEPTHRTPTQLTTTVTSLRCRSRPHHPLKVVSSRKPSICGVANTQQARYDQSLCRCQQQPGGIGLNEYLIRMGAAGLEGSAKGGLAASRRNRQNLRRTAGRRTQGTGCLQQGTDKRLKAKGGDDAAKQIGQIDEALFDMDRALQFLQAPGASVTGILDGTIMALRPRDRQS